MDDIPASMSEDNGTVMEDWQNLIKTYKLRPLSSDGYVWSGVYLLIVGILATVGNAVVILTICRNRKLRQKPHNQLLVNLAISDLGISIFGYPVTTLSSFAGRYLFGKTVCVIQGFTCFTLAQANMNTLAFLAIYRYISVCHPQISHYLRTSSRKVIPLAWTYALLWTVPPLLGWSDYTFESFGTSCSVDWTSREKDAVAYTWCLIVYCYIVHILIISACYFKIVMKVRVVGKNITNRPGFRLSEGEDDHRCKRERRVTMIALAMTVSFILIWSPYAFMSLWSVYADSVPVWMNVLPTMFAKASCMINPILYTFSNSTFRKYVSNLLCKTKDPTLATRPLYLYRRDTTKDDVYIGLRVFGKRASDDSLASTLVSTSSNVMAYVCTPTLLLLTMNASGA